MLVGLMFVAAVLQRAAPFGHFRNLIPNGFLVRHPCYPGELWPGVGHFVESGTGARNQFGWDFFHNDKTWTRKLCLLDSDGDGRHNGLELGDPDCEWDGSGPPKYTEGITHPGVCEPIDSPACMGRTIDHPKHSTQKTYLDEMCTRNKLDCEVFKDKDIRNVTVRFPPATPVPAEQTSYVCAIFDLFELGFPQEGDYHMVATTPAIDNENVIHHIVLFGCEGNSMPLNTCYQCGLLPAASCSTFINVWSLGNYGECLHPYCGVRLGKHGFRYVALQFHWTNDDKQTGLTDSSGLVIHYTPNKRRYNCGVILVGAIDYALPPQREKIDVATECLSDCTKHIFNDTIYFASGWNHMHKAGKSMSIRLARSGQIVTELTNDEAFNYDTPKLHFYDTPVEFRPGDSLITNCSYNTMHTNKTIVWGDGTDDEMCFGFMTIFPIENAKMSFCFDKMVISCGKKADDRCFSTSRFLKEIKKKDVFWDVDRDCPLGSTCQAECINTIIKFMYSEPCLRLPIIWGSGKRMASGNQYAMEFIDRIMPCKAEVDRIWGSKFFKDNHKN